MKKVLIVTYYWPPSSGPGVQRWLKFVKYLSKIGYTPIIFTVKKASVPNLDDTLLADVPSNAVVHKTNAYEPVEFYYWLSGQKNKKVEIGLTELKKIDSPIKKLAKYVRSNVFIPDAKIGWYFGNRKKLLNLVKEEGIATIITTGPPHSTHLFGDYIKKRLGIKWIADFRDPWTGIMYEKLLSRTNRSKKKNSELEQSVLDNADQIIVVSNGLKQEFKEYEDKIEIIHNGYDTDDLMGLKAVNGEWFELTYTGNFKPNQNLESLWKVIFELKNEIEGFSEAFRLKLVGNVNETIVDSISEFKISELVLFEDFVPHHDALRIMMNANVLLLPIPKTKDNNLILTGKIFEYLASGSRILSIGPVGGDADKILRDCHRAPMIAYEDEGALKNRLMDEFNQWQSNKQLVLKHPGTHHEKFSREFLTEQLSRHIA